jgi:hypothetical protein
MTDLLLRQAHASRAGAQGDDDYDVIGADGLVIGRIFKATKSPTGTPWTTRQAAMQAFARSWYRET